MKFSFSLTEPRLIQKRCDLSAEAVLSIGVPPSPPANPQQLPQHGGAVPQHGHSTARIVDPDDPRFQTAQPQPLGQPQDLNIEAKPLDLLQPEQTQGGLAVEELEPALGIVDGQSHQGADDQVEHLPGLTAQPGLRPFQQARVEVAGADDNVPALLQQRQQAVHLPNGGGEVGVSEKDIPPLALQHPVLDAVTFAPVAAVPQQAQPGIAAGDATDEVNRVVGGAVVHDHHLSSVGNLLQVSVDGGKSSGEALGFVEGGHNDGQIGSRQQKDLSLGGESPQAIMKRCGHLPL